MDRHRKAEPCGQAALRNGRLDLFGDDSSDRVTTTLGAEQEYFLISEKDYEKRLDIMLTGRTLLQ